MTDAPLARAATDLALAGADPLEHNPAAVYLARLAPSSRRVMRDALDAIADVLTTGRCDALTLDWPALRYQHTAAVRAVLADGRYAPSTANRHLAALRGVLKACWRLKQMDVEDYQRAVDLEAVRGSRLPRGRALSRGDVRELFDVCASGNHPLDVRDTAILAMQYGAGLRRAEIIGLDLEDLDRSTWALKIRGKGNKERTGYLVNGTRLAIEEWLQVRGDEPGPLFWPIGKKTSPTPGRLTGQAVLYIAVRWARKAKVRQFSPHDLRRTFISDLLEAGADISTVQQLAGHAQVTTTARYDRRGEVTKQRTASLLHVPYGGRRRGIAATAGGG